MLSKTKSIASTIFTLYTKKKRNYIVKKKLFFLVQKTTIKTFFFPPKREVVLHKIKSQKCKWDKFEQYIAQKEPFYTKEIPSIYTPYIQQLVAEIVSHGGGVWHIRLAHIPPFFPKISHHHENFTLSLSPCVKHIIFRPKYLSTTRKFSKSQNFTSRDSKMLQIKK